MTAASPAILRREAEVKPCHPFWQIEEGWATHRIGFSEKIDFGRVVRLALAVGFAAADPISHLVSPFLLYPYVLLSRLYCEHRQIGPARLAVVVFTVATTDVRSLTGKPRGWSHTAGCVPYFYPLRWNCTASSVAAACKGCGYIHVSTIYAHNRAQ